MVRRFRTWLSRCMIQWLSKERPPPETIACDYERLVFEIRPGDVLLVEGRSRISNVIKNITQSPWSHSALYIGRLAEMTEPGLQARIREYYDGDPGEQLILEACLGQGTIVRPLNAYRYDNLRICRPHLLAPGDARRVIAYALEHLGWEYDLRQLLDLARFLLPYNILPRRWRSSLFEYHPGTSTRTVCSSLIAAAFASVKYPIRPIIPRNDNDEIRLYHRNVRLYTPSDFDYSPYFDIIKYPYFGSDALAHYRQLPWDEQGHVCTDEHDVPVPVEPEPTTAAAPRETPDPQLPPDAAPAAAADKEATTVKESN